MTLQYAQITRGLFMANYITEDDIEVSLINILKSDELGYNFIQCDSDPSRKEDLMKACPKD